MNLLLSLVPLIFSLPAEKGPNLEEKPLNFVGSKAYVSMRNIVQDGGFEEDSNYWRTDVEGNAVADKHFPTFWALEGEYVGRTANPMDWLLEGERTKATIAQDLPNKAIRDIDELNFGVFARYPSGIKDSAYVFWLGIVTKTYVGDTTKLLVYRFAPDDVEKPIENDTFAFYQLPLPNHNKWREFSRDLYVDYLKKEWDPSDTLQKIFVYSEAYAPIDSILRRQDVRWDKVEIIAKNYIDLEAFEISKEGELKVGETVIPVGIVKNNGLEDIVNGPVGFYIKKNDSDVYSDIQLTNVESEKFDTLKFVPWTPADTGWYDIYLICQLPDDENPENDTLMVNWYVKEAETGIKEKITESKKKCFVVYDLSGRKILELKGCGEVWKIRKQLEQKLLKGIYFIKSKEEKGARKIVIY